MSEERDSEQESEQVEEAQGEGTDASEASNNNGGEPGVQPDVAAADEADSANDAGGDSEPPRPTERERLENERDRMKDQLLRIAADFDNFRKRARRELDDARRRAREDTICDMLPLVDNLERAAQAATTTDDVKAVADGISMVLRGFDDVASRLGLLRIDVVGERFDPNLHDAMQQQETDEHEPGTIVAEIVPGYMVGERLLRPAMVVVAKPPSADKTTSDSAAPESEDASSEEETPEDPGQ